MLLSACHPRGRTGSGGPQFCGSVGGTDLLSGLPSEGWRVSEAWSRHCVKRAFLAALRAARLADPARALGVRLWVPLSPAASPSRVCQAARQAGCPTAQELLQRQDGSELHGGDVHAPVTSGPARPSTGRCAKLTRASSHLHEHSTWEFNCPHFRRRKHSSSEIVS